LSNFSTTTSATSTSIWTMGVFFSTSTTAFSVFPYASSTALTAGNLFAANFTSTGNSNLTNATTTSFAISNVASGSLLKTTTGGSVLAAVAGTDYLTSATIFTYPFTSLNSFSTSTSATSSSILTQGVFFASSTVASSQFPYASSTALTAGNLFATNATFTNALTVANGGTGATTLGGGQVLFGNGTGAIGSVATGTVSGTNGITTTAGRFALGGALAIDCTVASGSAAGCLSSTDWTTFNNKQATISASWPITLSGATLGFNGLSTSTAAVIGNVPYFSSANTFANVATTSVTNGTAISFSGTAGALLGGSNLTINFAAPATAALSIPYASSTAVSSSYASSTSGFFGNLSIGSLSGFLKATAGAISTALVDLAANVTGILPVANGGTGWAAVAAGSVPYGNGSSALSTTTAGTGGYVLSYLNGVPTWAATTTFSTGLTYSSGAVTVNTTQNIAKLSNLTSNGFVKTSGGDGTLSVDTNTYLTSADIFAYPFPSNATTTLLNFNGGLTTANATSSTNFSNIFTASAARFGATATSSFSSAGLLTLAGITSSLLKTDGSNNVVAAVAGTDYLATYDAFTHANTFSTTTSATSSSIWTKGVFFSTSTTAFSVFPYASSTAITAGNLFATSATLTNALTVANGGTGAATITGILQGNGTNAFTAITDSSTAGQTLRVTGASTYAWGALDLANASAITGALPVSNGGTNIASYTPGDILYASAVTTLSKVASSTSGFVLALVNGIPSWVATTTLSTISGTLAVANGGTGATSLSGGQVLFGNGTGVIGSVATGTVSSSGGITTTAGRFALGG
ncbi:hypothetical protein HY971_00085, partial [Candidatus Kaiserbacteria bacterium]|nr:hypothetical protein [Candidatus Kaiserbacteria bacterium]